MSHLHHGALGSSGPVFLTLAIVLTALVYLRGWFELRSLSVSTRSALRVVSFLLGLSLIWIAVASPLAALDEQLLTAHMAQHLLLMTLAPPLIWLGEPVMAFSRALPRRFVDGVVRPSLRWPPAEWFGKALTRPAFCWLAATAALVGWHIPGAFTLGMQSGSWHMLQQASFLATGLLFWWPVVRPWPSVAKPDFSIILYLFLATLPCDILSGFLVFCDRVVYPVYLSSPGPFGFSALGDQECAGALMWTCVTVVYLVAGAILTTQLLSAESFRGKELVEQKLHGGAAPQRVPPRVEAV
jgi:putative membrane protein